VGKLGWLSNWRFKLPEDMSFLINELDAKDEEIYSLKAEVRAQQAEIERLRAALERAESNFHNAANALDDYDYRGAVPGRNGPVVAHRAEFHAAMVEQLDGYAKQCFAALTAQSAEGEKHD
jgi:hypothetical protein